ncbi:MAG: hypothetical protein AAGF31_07520 [Planctomycetota bacterium]
MPRRPALAINRCLLSFFPAAPLLAALLVASLLGCGYGEVSPQAYQYAKAIYNIAGRQASERIAPFREQVRAAHADGEISEQELAWLEAIADDAQAGNWKPATKAARRMMEDQVR